MNEYLYPKAPAVIVEVLLVALLIFTPLAFATVQTWAISVMEFTCLLMVAVWLIGVALSGGGLRFRFPLGMPMIVFAGLVFLQLVPHFIGEKVALAGPLSRVGTVNFFATKTAFIKLLCYIGLYICLVNTLTSRQQITRVLIAVIVIGFGIALLGLLQRISRTDKVFWFIQVRADRRRFMAAFINENHFAGYMELIIPITIAFMLRHLLRIGETGWRGVLASEDLHKAMLLAFLAIMMIVALAVSESRGGLVGFLGSLLAIAILLLCRQLHRRRTWVIVVLLSVSLLMLVWIGTSGLWKTWGTLGTIPADSSFKRRMEVNQDTWRASKDYPIWGSGLGTFETVFPVYGTLGYARRSGRIGLLRTTPHAEDDYVQTLLETGWVGLLTCLVGLVLFLKIAIKTYLTRRRRSISMPAMGACASIFAMLVHSTCDFNMRIDANVFLLVTIVAMVVSLSKVKSGRHRHSRTEEPA